MSNSTTALPDAAIRFGFSNDFSGASTSRTIMLPELQALLRAVPANARGDAYQQAVIDGNVLGKPTTSTRKKTFAFLRDRYGLDRRMSIFAALRALWDHDQQAQPLLAMLAALARDPALRATAGTVLWTPEHSSIHWEPLATAIDSAFPGKLTFKTLRSTAQNAAASWGQAGHIEGRRTKLKVSPEAHPTSAAYALLLGHLCGERGDALFETQWAHVLGVPNHRLRDLASSASQQGWIDYRHAGSVTEVGFSHLLPSERITR